MTKPVTVEIADELAADLAKVANDLGESQEQFVTRALAARIETFRDNPFFARRRAEFDRVAVADWLLEREGGDPPIPGDELPEGYARR
jgi:predicted transcriptional regulator